MLSFPPRAGVTGLFAAAVAGLLLTAPAPATAAEPGGVFLELTPTTVQAGLSVSLLASCGDDPKPATVRSRAFGEVTLLPQHHSGLLTGSVTVPRHTDPGGYRVSLHCAGGGSAVTDLSVLHMARPTRGPDTGGGGASAAPAAPVLLGAGGLAALGAGAGLLLHRRRTWT